MIATEKSFLFVPPVTLYACPEWSRKIAQTFMSRCIKLCASFSGPLLVVRAVACDDDYNTVRPIAQFYRKVA